MEEKELPKGWIFRDNGRERGRGRARGGLGRGMGGARRQGEEQEAARWLEDQAAGGVASSGSYHCAYHRKSSKCDVCGKMLESRSVMSSHFRVKHSIAGHIVHLPATQPKKHKWFVYLEECIHPEGTFQYADSTDSMTHRWANTKSTIHSLVSGRPSKAGTGLESHFKSFMSCV